MSDRETTWRELVSGETATWWAPLARGGLTALAGLYSGVVSAYRRGFDWRLLRTTRLECPVIAIGNITVGGTGKTTTVRWLTRRLLEWGARPAILSYGYRAGATEGDRDAVVVVAGPEGIREPVQRSGDEPQMLARSLPGVPVVIGRKRVLSGEHAYREFAPDVCLLDDAFQYWRLEKDLEIVLLNAANPFGFGHLFPRGMLREPLRALRRARAVVVTHAGSVSAVERSAIRKRLLEVAPDLVLAEARHAPSRLRDLATGESLPLGILAEGRWAALSGLGQPESFERSLAELGAKELLRLRFPDHHRYTADEVYAVREQVRGQGLSGLVTTEKDSVKIPKEWLDGLRSLVLEVDLELMSGGEELEGLVRSVLSGPRLARGSA